jgi:hypothetical protein
MRVYIGDAHVRNARGADCGGEEVVPKIPVNFLVAATTDVPVQLSYFSNRPEIVIPE